MISKKILFLSFWTLVITALVNFISTKFYLYWTIRWIDTIPHFFGGLTVALACAWFFSLFSDLTKWKNSKLLIMMFSGAIVIGLVWEIFELHFGITTLADGIRYATDTASDLTMDLVGGFFGFLWTRNLLKKYE